MDVKLLWLTVVLLSSPLLTLCVPLYVLSAPNLLRVGSSENVFVEAQDYSGGALDVKITVKNHPRKDKEIVSKIVRLTAENNYQILTDIKIADDKNYFSDDPLEKQYVSLEAQFPSSTLEKVVLVSFQSGYIFVQTDKPIYTPASRVFYRILSLTPNMKPLSQSGVTVEIMNPQGVTVSSEMIYPEKGMKSGRYAIPEVASSGIWKVVTRYANTPQKTFTADFEVKEHVLPTFEVKLKPSKSFYYVDDRSLTVDIEAKSLFGQKVEGSAFVVFGVMDGEKKISIADSLQRVQIMKGEGTAKLTREMITKTFPNINQLVGQSIYVSVSVLTESGSEMVEAERRGIQIVTSPYTIHFKKTPQFFKPGMPFSVSVYVTNPDKTPAENVEVEINPGGVRGRTRANGIAKVFINTLGGSSTLQITAKTKDPQLRDEQQAVKTMTARAYVPKDGSKNYLHISSDAAELQIGDSMTVYLNTGQNQGVKDFTYMILSKGQIVQANRYKRRGQALVALSLPVTKDMVPSFRFVAYYHVGSNEVVSDSVWVDVKDTCMGTLKLQVKDKMNTYGPRDEVKLQITGDPGARVGLVVVDKAVNVLNKNRLTQMKIWDVIEKHDTGCTAGSGRDSMGVFSDAGLMFESSTAGGTDTRTVSECPFLSKRRRRSLGDDDDYYTDSGEIVSRTLFPESWFWEEIDLCENCPAPSVKDKMIYLRDSITTRQILAVSVSPTLGICVAEPEEIVVFKPFFIDLKMPYSAVRGEQLEIKAIIHNYTPRKLKVRVEFMETEDVCSFASKKGKYRTTVKVDKESSRAVSYVIIPMTLGNHMIEVKASIFEYEDGVSKSLKVVSEGVLVQLHRHTVELNPVKNGHEPIIAKADLPTDRVPDTPVNTYITITVICSAFEWLVLNKQLSDGSFRVDSAVIQVEMVDDVQGKDAEASLTAFVVIAMQESRQICAESVGSLDESIRRAVSFLEDRLLQLTNPYAVAMTSYAMANAGKLNKDFLMKHSSQGEDGRSWNVPGQLHHSLEATAYAVLALLKAKDFDTAREAVRWLERQQSHYGGSGTTRATIMVFQAMAEYRTQVKDLKNFNLDRELAVAGRSKPVRYTIKRENVHLKWSEKVEINKNFNVTARGTGIAVLSVLTLYYARPVEKKSDCTSFNLTVKMEKDPEIKEGAIESYKLTMDFLYKSDKTDATMTILDIGTPTGFTVESKDLEKLSTGKERYIQKFEMDKVLSERGSIILYLEKVSHTKSQRISFRMHKMFNVGLLQPAAVTIYENYSPYARCTKFFHPERADGALYRLCKGDVCQCAEENCSIQKNIRVRKQERPDRSVMDYVYKVTVLDIDLLQNSTIYNMKVQLTLKESTVDKKVEGKVRPFFAPTSWREHIRLEKGKSYLIMGKSTDLSRQGGSLKYILGKQTWIESWPPREKSPTPENSVREEERLVRACESDMDYVYKVSVEGMDLGHDSDVYHLKVEKVLKEGNYDDNVEGKIRSFLARSSCREHLGLQQGKSYLVMGKSTDLPRLGGSLQYIFGEETWVENWPTREESQTPQYRDQFIGITELEDSLLREGCPT